MKQTARIISTYTADVSGAASALFELGGMTVMHDASGCNSTYNTHDEPRWYDQDSLVFISALSEMEAILGDDEKLVSDITAAALDLKPRFIAIAGTPIPMITGTDLPAVARRVERNTGIPAFGLKTNSMHSYLLGAGMALEAVARRFVRAGVPREAASGKVNVLGMTPLDFSVNGSERSIRQWLSGNGFTPLSVWAMGSTLDELAEAGRAAVNLVVSYDGLPTAKYLRETFGTPWVAGVPFGLAFSGRLAELLRRAAETGENAAPCALRPESAGPRAVIVGESVCSGSLAAAAALDEGVSARVVCPLETEAGLLASGETESPDEDDIIPQLRPGDLIAADPLYRPICPKDSAFYPLPSEAFSGRIYRKDIPNLIAKKTNLKG